MEVGYPTNREAVERRLVAELGAARSDSRTLEENELDSEIRDYLMNSGKAQFRMLVSRARSARTTMPGRRVGQKSGTKNQPKLTPPEKLRAKIFSRELGRFASREPEVQDLRTSLFGGHVPTHDQAEHLLLQVAPRYFPLDWFVKNRVPLLEHTSYFWNQGDVAWPRGKGTEIRVEWGGNLRRLRNLNRLAAGFAERGVYVQLPQPPDGIFSSARSVGGSRRRPVRIPVRSRNDLPKSLRASYVFQWSPARVIEGSVFGEMQRVASHIAASYHWTETESFLFLTEGRIPLVLPIDLNFAALHSPHHRRMIVTMEFEPWITDETLLNAFHSARRMSSSRQLRLVEERRLRLFDFVEEYRDKFVGKSWEEIEEDGAPFPWEEVAKRWVAKHPKWRYRSLSEMRATFRTTRKELLLPPLTKLWG